MIEMPGSKSTSTRLETKTWLFCRACAAHCVQNVTLIVTWFGGRMLVSRASTGPLVAAAPAVAPAPANAAAPPVTSHKQAAQQPP